MTSAKNWLAAGLMLVLVAGCGGRQRKGSRTGEGLGGGSGGGGGGLELEVWSAVIRGRLGPAIVAGASHVQVAEQAVRPPCAVDEGSLRAAMPSASADTVADFVRMLPRPRLVRPIFKRPFRAVLLTEAAYRAAAATPATSHSAGVVGMSRVGIGNRGTEALVYFRALPTDGWLIHLQWRERWLERAAIACPTR